MRPTVKESLKTVSSRNRFDCAMNIRAAVESLLPKPLWRLSRAVHARLNGKYVIRSYSYSGEDMVLRAILKKRRVTRGFYVDVGAYHPIQLSNTYYFYRNGWRGINIDARPGSMELFRLLRHRDINVEAAIAKEPGQMTFSIFESLALNTLDSELAQARVSAGCRMVKQVRMNTRTLAEVLEAHKPADQRVHFLSVDVEGFDLDVLASNDWSTCRPELVVVECETADMEEVRGSAIHEFMRDRGYYLISKTMFSLVFQDRSASNGR